MTLAELRARCYDELAEDESSPSRYPATDVREYLNDGIAYYTARVGHEIATSPINQTANQLWYDLPSDCLQIRRITRDASTGSYSKLLQPLNARLLDYQWGLNKRWGQDVDTRARGYMPFSTDRIALYPNIASDTVTDGLSLYDSEFGSTAQVEEVGSTYTIDSEVGVIVSASSEDRSMSFNGEFGVIIDSELTGSQRYTLTYRQDIGYSSLSADTDEPPIPDEDHDALPLYAVARCLLVDGKVKDGLRHWTAWLNRVRGAKARRSSAERLWQNDLRGSL